MKSTTWFLSLIAAGTAAIFARRALAGRDPERVRHSVEERCDAASRELQRRIGVRDRQAA